VGSVVVAASLLLRAREAMTNHLRELKFLLLRWLDSGWQFRTFNLVE
jgi:hypothetical protein